MGDPFQVVREIGRGATGAVYEVRLPGRAEPMAAKVLEVQTDQARQRFEREGSVMARFRHPNVATVHEVGVLSRGAPYLLLDLIQGGTLEDVLERDAPLLEERVRELLTPVASGLAHAHQLGTTHRDLKPANILLTRAGTPIVSDFGVAQSLELERLTLTGAVVGTPAYMAPEQQRVGAAVGPGSDVYALGVILYEALTGELPYATTDPRLKGSGVSAGMARIVQRCLQPDPSRRYSDAGEVLRALEVAEGTSLGRPWLAIGVVSALVIPFLLAGVVWAFTPLRAGAGSPTPAEPSLLPSPSPSSSPRASRADLLAPAPTAPVRLELELGDRQRGVFRRVATNTMGEQDLSWRVEHEVVRRGVQVLTIQATITWGRLIRMDGTVVFDSERPQATLPEYEALRALIGRRYVFNQDRGTGRVLAVRGGNVLMQELASVGFPGMEWLSNSSLRSFMNALFGVLPGGVVEPGQGWTAPGVISGLSVDCRVLAHEPGRVVIEGDHQWDEPGLPSYFRSKQVWSAGEIHEAVVELEETGGMVAGSKLNWSWKLLAPEGAPQPKAR